MTRRELRGIKPTGQSPKGVEVTRVIGSDVLSNLSKEAREKVFRDVGYDGKGPVPIDKIHAHPLVSNIMTNVRKSGVKVSREDPRFLASGKHHYIAGVHTDTGNAYPDASYQRGGSLSTAIFGSRETVKPILRRMYNIGSEGFILPPNLQASEFSLSEILDHFIKGNILLDEAIELSADRVKELKRYADEIGYKSTAYNVPSSSGYVDKKGINYSKLGDLFAGNANKLHRRELIKYDNSGKPKISSPFTVPLGVEPKLKRDFYSRYISSRWKEPNYWLGAD